MDRIYYFLLAKDNRIFQKRVGQYEIFYLMVSGDEAKQHAADVRGYMEKGIRRLLRDCDWEVYSENVYLVYDGAFENWLKQQQMDKIWQQLWERPPYVEYKASHNLVFLLNRLPKEGRPGDWIILGEAPGWKDWLPNLARYIKSICVYSLTEPKDWEDVRALIQHEYGLMMSWQKSLQPRSREPAIVLDYCGRENVFVWGVPPGSVWIDMTSLESRRHAIQDRDTGIVYDSLKSFWREEMIQTLDTADKIQYNT